MNHKHRGIALLFLNNFKGTPNELAGHAQDKINLKKTLELLNFKIILQINKSKEETIEILNYYAKKHDHSNSDCFLCVFSSHGDDSTAKLKTESLFLNSVLITIPLTIFQIVIVPSSKPLSK